MKITNWKIIFAAAALLSLFLVSCDEETTDPEPTTFEPAAPTNLMATSIDESTVRIVWTHSTDVNHTDFSHYEITITGGEPFEPITIEKTYNSADISNLSQGTVYAFEIRSISADNEASEAATIMWSPASRFNMDIVGFPVKVYASNTKFGSGLNLYEYDVENDQEGPVTYTVSDGENWDLGLYTSNDEMKFGSAKLIDYNYGTDPVNTVEVSSEVITGVSSLDEVLDSKALNHNPDYFAERLIDLSQYNENIVLIVRRMKPEDSNYHYAKVFIPYQNGSFLTYDAGLEDQKYISVTVSYQKEADVPYARVKR